MRGYNPAWTLCCLSEHPRVKALDPKLQKEGDKHMAVEMNGGYVKEKVTSDQQAINSTMSHWQENKHIISLTLKLRLTRAVPSESEYLLTAPGAAHMVGR